MNVAARLATLGAKASNCRRCPLADDRTHVVFGEGDPAAGLMILGEAPGKQEDQRGRPFCGPAGTRLTALLREIRMDRADVYIANVVMCRPPGNRRPRRDEVVTCAPFLDAQLRLVAPRVLITLGASATRRRLGSHVTVAEARGRAHDVDGVAVVPTYHPAALNRVRGRAQQAVDDFWLARRILDRLAEPRQE